MQRRQWQPTPVLLPGKSHGRRSLVGCSPWGCKKLDTTEQIHFHFSLSYIVEGNGNPLHCSCLENPRDGGAWWAAVCGVGYCCLVTQSYPAIATPWPVAHQAPLSLGFPRQEHWSGVSFHSPGDVPDSGIGSHIGRQICI